LLFDNYIDINYNKEIYQHFALLYKYIET